MDATALYKFHSGLYVISAQAGEDVGACIINTGLQLTSNPLQVEAVVNKQNHTENVIAKAGHFALTTVTESANMLYIGRFGFRTSADYDKFDGIETERTVLGDPYTPENAACVLACKVVGTLDVGTHMIFVGEVEDAKNLSDVPVMTYAYYHSVLKGKTPPKASSFIGEA
ncbi:MAG: flavin reductase family protein [Atopobiaceae bacterium]|jgi:ferric-chelate reductase [NAD(P)H]|nr:flavin reductase family protein [Atopobiaceae bacterium]